MEFSICLAIFITYLSHNCLTEPKNNLNIYKKWETQAFWMNLGIFVRKINGIFKVLVSQLCLTLCDPMDCSPPGSSVRKIFQARILEWVAISFSMFAVGLSYMAFIMLRYIPSMPTFWRIFIINGYWYCQRLSLSLLK